MGHDAFDRIFGDFTVDQYMIGQADLLCELAPDDHYFDIDMFLDDIQTDGNPRHLSAYYFRNVDPEPFVGFHTAPSYVRRAHSLLFEDLEPRGLAMMFEDYDSSSDSEEGNSDAEEMPPLVELVRNIELILDALDVLLDNPQIPPAA